MLFTNILYRKKETHTHTFPILKKTTEIDYRDFISIKKKEKQPLFSMQFNDFLMTMMIITIITTTIIINIMKTGFRLRYVM